MQTQRGYTAFVHITISRLLGGNGMKGATPIISRGMHALCLPFFFNKLGHSNVILAAGGQAFRHKDGPKHGVLSCSQAEEAWIMWKAGQYGGVRLSDGIIEYAKTHAELKGAFLTFRKEADQIYPGWKEQLGYDELVRG